MTLLICSQVMPCSPRYRAVPLVATGVVLYGAYLVLVSAVARMVKTGSLFPVAAAGRRPSH